MPIVRRARGLHLLAALFAVGHTICAPAADLPASQPYPNRPIHIVVAEAGAQSDTMARALAPSLRRTLGQPIVVENRGGAGGTVGAQSVAQARADGYTLLIGGLNNIVLATLLRSHLPYDAAHFLPLVGLIRVPYGIAVSKRIPVGNIEELAVYARAHPGEVSFASGGTGSTSQLALELLRSRLDLNMMHVPYRGVSLALPDLIGSRVDVVATDLARLLPLHRTGSARIIAVSGASRAAAAPQIATVAEQGLPGYDIEPWYGLFAPAGTPADILESVSRAVTEALRSEEVRTILPRQGYEPMPMSSADLRDLIAAETRKYADLIDKAGLRNSQ